MNKTFFLLAIVAFIPDGCTYGDYLEEDISDFEVIDRTVPEYEGQHWYERYVNDACERCPDCCVTVTEKGFIDPYGVERPLDWLPEDEETIRDLAEDCNAVSEDLFGDSEFCSSFTCPGDTCPCVVDDQGRWWIDATLGD